MTLDSWLVARLAKDLATVVSGARIQGLSATANSIVFYCYRRGKHISLHASVDSNAPCVAAMEQTAPQKEIGTTGWAGSVAALLRGSVVDAVHAVPNDRILYVDVSSRSSFGVPSHSRIVIELQTRKANALILRSLDDEGWMIVAAAKQFDGSRDARTVRTGARYEPPPTRRSRLDRAQFILAARDLDPSDAGAFAKLLGEFDPECTPPLAREVVFRTASRGAGVNARSLLTAWPPLRSEVEDALEEGGDVFVARKNGKVFACHLIPLRWALDAAGATSASQFTAKSVNELCIEMLSQTETQTRGPVPVALRKRLATMLARCEKEMADLESARRRAGDADALRDAGDAIYANLSRIAAGSDRFETPEGRHIILDPLLTPKQNAAAYFRKYKKSRSGLPQIEARLRALRGQREYWEHLQWEIDRLDLAAVERESFLEEIASAVGSKKQIKRRRAAKAPERRVALSGGAVALVGRSPKDNERLTFSVAGPNDYWFHARGVPGAHVIVKTDGADISTQQIEEAAALAAGHSRASGSASVEVDYTRRKHVRRQSNARPGLVWYTNFESVRVRPQGA